MINLDDRNKFRLIKRKQQVNLPLRWIVIAGIGLILFVIIFFFRKIYLVK